jgi:hypothetical protein
VFFIVLSCFLVIFYSTAELDLFSNGLTGTIPSQLGLLTKLSKSSVVWLLVVMILLSCFFILYSHACLSFFIAFTAQLYLYSNSLTGTIPSQLGLLSQLSKFGVVCLLVVMIVLLCVFFIVL